MLKSSPVLVLNPFDTWSSTSSPVMSAVRKVALFARPSSGPVSASTSSMVRSDSIIPFIAATMPYTPSRLATNPGTSFAMTMPLPSTTSLKRRVASSASGAVSGVGMSSSRCRYRGGLKKCIPRKCRLNSALRPSTSTCIGIPDVFDAMMAVGLRSGSSLA